MSFIIIFWSINKNENIVVEREVVASAKIKEDPVLVYDNLTIEELSSKLNRVMKSQLEGKGELFASYAIEMGVDPYIALAIVFQETGCYYGYCSQLVVDCNNIGGMKGGSSNKCYGGSYSKFDTIDDGIKIFIDNLSYGYFSQGLTTPELMNKKYAEDPYWASRVNNYVNIIKNS